MGKVFSWKIDDYKYGYIKSPNGKSHVSERITNPSIISSMADIVKSWDLNTYTENFNEMNNEILGMFGVSIPGEAADYFNEESGNKNYIVLTGKDGSSSCNVSALKESDIEKISNAVNEKIGVAMSEIHSLETSLKSWVSDKTNSTVASANMISQSVISSVNTMTQEMSNKIEDAENAIQTAASLFDMNNSGVNKENLISAINNANSAMTWAISTDAKNKQTDADIKNINNNLALLTEKQNATSNMVDSVNTTIQTNIGKINAKITKLENDVTDIKEVSAYSSASESSANKDVALKSSGVVRKIPAKAQNEIVTNITENNDGTYTSNIKIGNESYDINIIGYGGKIDDSTNKEGLSLASNGFKYVNGGSMFSVTNGGIVLSNKDGSASIEINENGVYINGKKQR